MNKKNPVYLDYNATTPLDEEVPATMLPFLTTEFGNSSSSHIYGEEPHRAVEKARKQIAELLGCAPESIVFTSGGTESNNWVIRTIAHTLKNHGNHIITSRIEHAACHENTVTVSSVISALGVDSDWAAGTIGFSTGKYTEDDEIIQAAETFTTAWKKLSRRGNN